MPREAKPYEERGWYISRVGGRYTKLCRTEEGISQAKRLLKKVVADLDNEREKLGGLLSPKLKVSEMLALFLNVVEAEKSRDTYRDYQRWCAEFELGYGSRAVQSLTKADASDFKLTMMKKTYVVGKQPPKPYKPKTVNHAIITLKRAFNWAIETDRLPSGRNPFANLKLLPCEGRQRVATEDEYQKLCNHCTDDAFRHVLIAMRHSSARPQDIYGLKWSMVDWKNRMWVIHKHKGTHTQRVKKPRIIGMGAVVESMLRERAERDGSNGHVFLNADGNPWTKDALVERMSRLRDRAGVRPDANGEKFVLYTNRHTFLTVAGANPALSQGMLMEVAGHSDSRTTDGYVHAKRLAVAEAGRRVADGISALISAGNDA